MKFMLTWRTRPGLYKAAFQQFLETGGPPPKGVEQVARYHVPGLILGWHVLETNDMSALAEHVNNWGDLIDMELNPIVEDAQAAEAAARVFGNSSPPVDPVGSASALGVRACHPHPAATKPARTPLR